MKQKPEHILESITDAVIAYDTYWRYSYVNKSAEKVIGAKSKDLVGKVVWELYPQAKETDAAKNCFIVMKTRKAMRFQTYFPPLNKWFDMKIYPAANGITTYLRDITEEKQAEERQKFLDTLSKKLVTSLDRHVTLQEIAQIIISHIADYCRVAVIDKDANIKEIAVSHKDPRQVTVVEDLYKAYQNDPNSTFGIPSILRTGKPQLLSKVDEKVLETVKQNKKLVQTVKKLGLQSYMGVPLVVRGKVMGAITFSSIRPYRFYTRKDLKFAEEIAHRIALMLENIRLYEEAQAAIVLRDDFISMASHELKTPLTSINLFTRLLKKQITEKHDEKSEKILEKMENNLDKLIALVRDLLDVSKMQQGKLSVSKEQFFIKELVEDIIEDVQPISKHTLIVDWHTKLPVAADKERIRQVLVNLITNAIKYSPKADKVIIGSRKEGNYILVFVQDFGLGIPESEQEKIFQRFYQSNGNKTYPGLGLGLYISTQIIKSHGGKLWVKSEHGKGAIFYFMLPIASR